MGAGNPIGPAQGSQTSLSLTGCCCARGVLRTWTCWQRCSNGRGLLIGYGSAAVLASLRVGFDELGLDRIVAVIETANAACAWLVERIGLRAVRETVESRLARGLPHRPGDSIAPSYLGGVLTAPARVDLPERLSPQLPRRCPASRRHHRREPEGAAPAVCLHGFLEGSGA